MKYLDKIQIVEKIKHCVMTGEGWKERLRFTLDGITMKSVYIVIYPENLVEENNETLEGLLVELNKYKMAEE